MRLEILDNGHRRMQKVLFVLVRRLLGGNVPGPILTMSYRRELCGKKLALCFQEGMRECQEWPKGDVELFAAFVSQLNQCAY